MLNITRTWNAVCAVSSMQRGLFLARDYAKRRVAFGSPLSEKPLHLETLADLAADHEACLALAFQETLLLGRSEVGKTTPSENAVLSVLQPLTKLFTAKVAVASASEVLECFGGAGYVEDTGLPALLRDAQVLSIWEGTTNVLALESLRSLVREDAWAPLLEFVRARAAVATEPRADELGQRAVRRAERALDWARSAGGESRPALEAGARRFAISLTSAVALALLVEQAELSSREGEGRSLFAATRFAARANVDLADAIDFEKTRAFALGEPVRL
jgi:hypothetical protein